MQHEQITRGIGDEPAVNRRRFLMAGTAVAIPGLAAVSQPSLWDCLFASTQGGTNWPITCRDVMLKRSGAPDCWSAMNSYGVDGVESDITDDLTLPGLFGPHSQFSVATAEKRAELATALEKAGKKITAFCMHNRFEERPEFEVQWCRQVAQAAKELNVPVIRIDVVPRKMPRPEFLEFAAKVLREVISITEATGARFGIENHGNTTNDPDFLDALFSQVDSPRLGLTLDTANFYWYGHPLSHLYEIYEHFASRVFHTHCKSINYPPEEREKKRPMGWEYAKYHCPVDKGDIDFARVVTILKKAGYQNDLCIENEGLGKLSPEEAIATVRGEVAYLRAIASKVS